MVFLPCEESWSKSGESVENAVGIIRVLAVFSLERRELVVPEDKADLSDEFGNLIKVFCTAAPDGLLYNAVDKAIRRLL